MSKHFGNPPRTTFRGEFARVSGTHIFCGKATLRDLGLIRRLQFSDLIDPLPMAQEEKTVYANQNYSVNLNDIFH